MTVSAEDGADLLALCREEPAFWAEAACGDGTGDDGRWTDPNATRRYALLLALQYDLRPEDRALVRYLFEQETLRHRREPFQGLYPALPLAGYLLSIFRVVEHVWVFAEARLTNFDAYCGFDREHLISAGIEETLAHVRAASDSPLRRNILGWLTRDDGQCMYSEEELAAWRRRTAASYPSAADGRGPQGAAGAGARAWRPRGGAALAGILGGDTPTHVAELTHAAVVLG